jgi:hypothetical protein
MTSRILGLGALGLACVLAAGGGAFLAVRQAETGSQAAPLATQVQPAAGTAVSQGAPAAAVATPKASDKSTPGEASHAVARPGSGTLREERSQASAGRPKSGRVTSASPSESGRQVDTQSEESSSRPAAAQSADAVPPPVAALPPVQSLNQPPAEPTREFVDVTVPAESVLGLQVQTAVSSETAKVEDRVEARVTRDVRVNDRIAIPAGSEVLGSVVQVDRGGKVKDRAHFAIRFHTLILPDGSRTPMTAEALHREGPSPANKSAAKIGGAAVGGAILGAILGGGKGAAIGTGIGAAGGTAATMAGEREPATLAAGSVVNLRLMSPLTVTLER